MSIEDAIQNAVGRASRTLRQVGWFEVVETRGHVEDRKVAHHQVALKVGFKLDDDDSAGTSVKPSAPGRSFSRPALWSRRARIARIRPGAFVSKHVA
jgi:dodecin